MLKPAVIAAVVVFALAASGPAHADSGDTAHQGEGRHEEASHKTDEAHDEAGHHDHDEDEAHHLAEHNGVRALHAWTPATDGPSALVFVTIENRSGKDVRLEGAESELAEAAELVGFQMQDGEPAYVALPFVPVKPGRELVLQPNGLAIRLTGLSRPLSKGGEIEVEFHFDTGHIAMHVQVEAANAANHSHAGHQH